MSDRPTVALVGPFPPPHGGMATYFTTLADLLQAEGFGCQRIKLPFGSAAERLSGFLGASSQILRTHADVVHCITGSQPNLLANALPLGAAQARRKPSLLSIVGGEFHGAAIDGSAIRRQAIRAVVSLPDRVTACNDDIAFALRSVGLPEKRIAVLSNALPVPTDQEGSALVDAAFVRFAESHRPLVSSVSGWYEHYGSMDLVRAVAGLRERHPKLGLALVIKAGGDAQFARALRAWIARAGLSEHVIILENVLSTRGIMARSSVFARTPHMEGDSISVREALEVGVPVVASDAGFRPDGVILYRPADPVDLEEKLERVLAASKVGSVAEDDQPRHNLEVLLELYRSLAGSRHAPCVRRPA